ncbi:MAG: hypothetical protein ACD_80C00011G0013 [uncultured bacterium (gcode 4)]|uniref:Peptidase E n=1 Tax=uncultured bacterium (gcode 4) TaxID=1234023 RepID=K1XKA3_9BACT|nr:MAG: hypothetical protein ACD_80C00011G0013 [uncultured bacterium (gcode 4)]
MTKLVVSWWGDHTDTKKIDALYKWLLVNKKILYIPRAMRPEEYPSCLEWIQNIFPISEWYSVDVLSEKEFTENNKNHLDDYDGMYIGWGNTYRLLKLIRDTWFSDIIQRFIDNNKPIYGWSAGAIIMGKEIHTAADMNAVKLSFEETLWYNVCKDYSIVCHYNEESENEIKDYAKYYQIPVICLPEGTGLIYDNNICTVQWEKSAYMIDISLEKKELPIWSRI